jgi:hypothetical protein
MSHAECCRMWQWSLNPTWCQLTVNYSWLSTRQLASAPLTRAPPLTPRSHHGQISSFPLFLPPHWWYISLHDPNIDVESLTTMQKAWRWHDKHNDNMESLMMPWTTQWQHEQPNDNMDNPMMMWTIQRQCEQPNDDAECPTMMQQAWQQCGMPNNC